MELYVCVCMYAFYILSARVHLAIIWKEFSPISSEAHAATARLFSSINLTR